MGEDCYFALYALFNSKKVTFLADYYGYYYKIRDSKKNTSVTNKRDVKNFNSSIKSNYYTLNLINKFPIGDNYTIINYGINNLLEQFYTLDPGIKSDEKTKLANELFKFEKHVERYIKIKKIHKFLNYFIINKHFKTAILFSNIIGYFYTKTYIRKFIRKIINH